MSSDLKKLVDELEVLLIERGGSLDAPARREFEGQIERLRTSIDGADVVRTAWLRKEALQTLASLLSVLTNVITLLK
ncbi:MAG: hypothetical protein KDJ27_19185 [Gammaproteobacteria bacterium]|nr:hypothetical protein [Gammaproteobacteria bacterium]